MSGCESTIVVLRLWSKVSELNHSTIHSPIYFNTVYTVKPVIKGHHWDKEKGDLLIQVTAWTVLTVYLFYLLFKIFMFQWLVWSPSYHSNEVLCQHKRYSFTIYSKFLLSMIHKMTKIYMENLQTKKRIILQIVILDVYCLKWPLSSDLWQIAGFLQVLQFPPSIKMTATISLKYWWKWC